MESMAKCTPENFCYVQVCTLDYDSCAESARYVGSVKDWQMSGGCTEKRRKFNILLFRYSIRSVIFLFEECINYAG